MIVDNTMTAKKKQQIRAHNKTAHVLTVWIRSSFGHLNVICSDKDQQILVYARNPLKLDAETAQGIIAAASQACIDGVYNRFDGELTLTW